MREIRFRGKRVDNGEWVYGYYVQQGLCTNGYLCEHGIMEPHCYAIEVDPATVGQFTGLKDSAGVDIYVGDIVHSSFTSMNVLVEFGWYEEEESRHYGYHAEGCQLGEGMNGCIWPLIVGNIHDNPELIGGAE